MPKGNSSFVKTRYAAYVNAPKLREAKKSGGLSSDYENYIACVHEIGKGGTYGSVEYDKVHFCARFEIKGPVQLKTGFKQPFDGDCGEAVYAWLETDAEVVLHLKDGTTKTLPGKELPKAEKKVTKKKVRITAGELEVETVE